MSQRSWLRILLIITLAAVGLLALLRYWQASAQPEPPTVTPTAIASTPLATFTPTAAAQTATPTTVPATATPAPTPTPGPTVAPDLALEYTRVGEGETLGIVAARNGVTVDEIAAASGIADPNIIAADQPIIIPHRPGRTTPDQILIPDSEFVYGPAYVDFDLAAFIEAQGGYLARFRMTQPNGEEWTAAQVIEHIAQRYSVGPRVLLALIEARSGWVTHPEPAEPGRSYVAGHFGGASGLMPQLDWAANELNQGFYGWLDRGETAIRYHDGVLARGAPGLNAATVAVQRTLARDMNWAEREADLNAFAEAYERLFGDPMALGDTPVRPVDLTQPELALPWSSDETWYLVGGPHGGWRSGSGWAALDFVPETAPPGSCAPAEAWARAAAPGLVIASNDGEVLLDLDMDGDVRTGWVLQYLHMADAVPAGTRLATGDPVGHPSCEGGLAESSHLHLSRRYNGLWVAAGGPSPFILDGWWAFGDFEYQGGMEKPGVGVLEACDCRSQTVNAVTP